MSVLFYCLHMTLFFPFLPLHTLKKLICYWVHFSFSLIHIIFCANRKKIEKFLLQSKWHHWTCTQPLITKYCSVDWHLLYCKHLFTNALNCRVYIASVVGVWIYGARAEWYWQEKTKALEKKRVPVPICPPQSLHWLSWDWIQTPVVTVV